MKTEPHFTEANPRYWIEQRHGDAYYVCSDMMRIGLGPFGKDEAEKTVERLTVQSK